MRLGSVKYGAIFSYLLIFLNTAYGLLVTPYILSQIGDSQYGVYKTISSLSASLAVLDLGFGGTVLRYVAKFAAERKKQELHEYLGMALTQTFLVLIGVLLVGSGVYFALEPMYAASFTVAELHLAKQLFWILLANLGLNFFENVFFGIIAGHNQFAFANGMKILLLLGKIAAVFILLPIYHSALVIVLAQLVLTFLVMLVHIAYMHRKLCVRFVFNRWNSGLFWESFRYTLLLFLQSVVIQFNGNVDNIVIGAVKGSEMVTLYSFALMLFNMYEQLSSSFSGIMLPTVTKRIHDGASAHDLENLVIQVGRIQFMILGAALCGFAVVGREFIALWLGAGFEDCYSLALILMTPVTIPLIQNVCLSILRAKNMMGFRTVALVYSMVVNCILTVFGTKYYGIYAAAFGTALSTVIGSVISMNIYYYKKLHMNVFRMLWETICKILPGLAAASGITILCKALFSSSLHGALLQFLVPAAVFIAVYGVVTFVFCKDELKRLLKK